MKAGSGSWGAFAFGPGTKYPVVALDGVLDLPGVRSRDLDRAEDHGSFSLPDYTEARTVVLSLGLRGADATELAALESVLRSAFQPVSEPQPLYLFDSTVVLYAKPRRRALPMDSEYLQRLNRAVIEFVCPDPRVYAEPATALGPNRLPSTTAVGFGAPISPPFGTGGVGAGGDFTATNTGSTSADVTYTIAGPVTNPVVRNNTTGDQVAFTITLAAGDTLVVDTATKTVLLNGTASRRSTMQAGSRYPRLAPGPNTIQFRGAGGTGALAVVRTNFATNPAPNVDTTNWSGNAGTGGTASLARLVPGVGVYPAPFPNATNRLTWSVANTVVGGNVLHGSATRLAVDPIKPLSATCVTRASKAQRVALNVDWYTAAGAFISTSTATAVVLTANTPTVLSLLGATPPGTAASCQVYVAAQAGTGGVLWAAADWLEMGGLLVEQAATVGNYFDGATPAGTDDSDAAYAWTGAANASSSTQSLPSSYGTLAARFRSASL